MKNKYKIITAFVITILCVAVYYTVTSNTSTGVQTSKINSYRIENEKYFDELSKIVYNATIYEDRIEDKKYLFRDVQLDSLNDSEYYSTIKSIFSLARQESVDKELSANQIDELNKKIGELENLATKYDLENK